MGGNVCSTIRGNNLEETRTEISGNIYSARRYGSDEQCHWYLEPPWEEYLLTFDIVRNKVRCNDGDFQILGKQFCNTNHKCAYYSKTSCPNLPVDARCAEIPRNNNLPHLEVHFEGLRNAVNNGGFNLNYEFHSCPEETTTTQSIMGTTTREILSTEATTEILTTTTELTTPDIVAQTSPEFVPTTFASTTAENIAQTTRDYITTAFEITNTEDTAHTTPDLISTTIETTTPEITFPTTQKLLTTIYETTSAQHLTSLPPSTTDYPTTAFEATSGESINSFTQTTQESMTTTALDTTTEEYPSSIPISTQDYMTTALETTTPENIAQSTKDFITTTIETTTTRGFAQTTQDFITTTIDPPTAGNFVQTTKEIMTSVIDENKETDVQLTTLLPTPTNRMSPREGPDPGILAGIIICGIIFVTLITILLLILVRRKKLKKLKIQNGHEMQSSQKRNGPINVDLKPDYEAVPKVAESALAPGFVLSNNPPNQSPHSDHTYVTTPHQQRNGKEFHNKINMPIKTGNTTDPSTKQVSSNDLIYNGIGNPCVFSYENKAYDNSHDDSSQTGTLSFISTGSSDSGDSYDTDTSDEGRSQDGLGEFDLAQTSYDIYSEQNMRNEILSTKVTKM